MISATDPFAVIAIFGTLGADEDFNSFGEAVLTDSVAFVIYETVPGFRERGDDSHRRFCWDLCW